MRQMVCLSMIVKNESAVIRRCLESVTPYIDRWAIVDTGSTDGTPELIRDIMGTVPGAVTSAPHRRTWWQRALGRNHFDFSKHRNIALDLAREQGCDYILLIDADEEFDGNDAEWWPELTDDRYCATFRVADGGRTWHRTLLVRSAYPWRYIHPVHEVLHSDEDGATAGLLGGVEVASHSDGARNGDKIAKYLADAEHLLEAIRNDPGEPRHYFYAGQSYAGAGRFRDALHYYEKRAAMTGWDEERWYALYQQAPLQELLGYQWDYVRASYLKAYAQRPTRAEPLWAAGVLSVDHGEAALGELYLRQAASLPKPSDSFLLDESIYRWRAVDDLAGALAPQGRADECANLLRGLLESGNLPDAEVERVQSNLTQALAHAA